MVLNIPDWVEDRDVGTRGSDVEVKDDARGRERLKRIFETGTDLVRMGVRGGAWWEIRWKDRGERMVKENLRKVRRSTRET